MLFVIGWSGIVSASVKTMQMDVSHHRMIQIMDMSATHSAHSSMSHHDIQADQEKPCHDMLVNHCKMSSAHNATVHSQCNDCSILHCQTMFSSLENGVTAVIDKQLVPDFSSILNFNYSAQYSKGYWQDLLRPPQA
jgi:hypothetical protein